MRGGKRRGRKPHEGRPLPKTGFGPFVWYVFHVSLLCTTEALGKRNHTLPCSSAELFFAEKNGVHRGKISVVDMAVLVFIGFLSGKFSLRPEKFSKRFSFGGGCARFFLL